MEIYLIRHTKPDIEKNICYGQLDVDLADSFENDFEQLHPKLPTEVDIIYTSPLKRCVKLVKKITEKCSHGIEISKTDNRLKELNFGDWEGKLWDEIDTYILDEWMRDFVSYTVSGGENFEELNNRSSDFWTKEIYQHRHNQKCILIVSHAGVIRSLLCFLQNIALNEAFNIKIDLGSVSKIVLTPDEVRIVYINH